MPKKPKEISTSDPRWYSNKKIIQGVRVIGVIGSRTRDSHEDYLATEQMFFEVYQEHDWICSGLCKEGGDRFAKLIHEAYAIPCLWFPPDKEKYGYYKCYIMRDRWIAQVSDILIACWDGSSTGTKTTMDMFEKYHKERGAKAVVL